jgi:HAD superfamily PSPase-like hydrolase
MANAGLSTRVTFLMSRKNHYIYKTTGCTMKAVVFDMDGTLIAESSWQLLHYYFHADPEGVKQNWEAYFSARIDYETWMEKDILLWDSPSLEDVRKGFSSFTLSPYADVVVKHLKTKEITPCIVSSGIDILAEKVGKSLGIASKFIFANSLIVVNGNLQGVCRVEPTQKDRIVSQLVQHLSIPLSEVVAVGDTASDISLFRGVGLKFAYNPKDDQVVKAADYVINDLRELLKYC